MNVSLQQMQAGFVASSCSNRPVSACDAGRIHSVPRSIARLPRFSQPTGQFTRSSTRRQKWLSNIRAARVEGTDLWSEKGTTINMKSVHSVEELTTELAIARDRLVVLDFYANWCGACKALYPKLCKLSDENPEMVLLKVNFDQNKQLCKALGVKVLPFFQFYRGAEGRVAEFSASVAKVQRLRDALAEHSPARCSLGNESPGLESLNTLLASREMSAQEGAAVRSPASAPAPSSAQAKAMQMGQAAQSS